MIKQIYITIQGIFKAFWNASMKIVWGVAGILLLAGLKTGWRLESSGAEGILSISVFLIKYWVVFWIVFFIRDLYFELRMELFD